MTQQLPASAKHLIIGAGVHGLSTAWHLAQRGEEALVIDKGTVGAGASGACDRDARPRRPVGELVGPGAHHAAFGGAARPVDLAGWGECDSL